MKYYHGSNNPNLTELSIHYANHGAVFLTKRYASALLYAASTCRFWKYDKQEDKIIFREVAENGLEKMYKGKKCYIYTTEDVKNVEEYEYNGCKNYKTLNNVKLESKETIEDAYEKIMELYNKGEIKIWFWKDYSEEDKKQIKESIKSTICSDMVLNYTKFREDYDVLVKLFPEFALTEKQIAEIERSKLYSKICI